MTAVPALLDRGDETPERRAALVGALLVVLGAMRDAGMCGPVVGLIDAEPSDSLNAATLTPPESITPLALEVRAALAK